MWGYGMFLFFLTNVQGDMMSRMMDLSSRWRCCDIWKMLWVFTDCTGWERGWGRGLNETQEIVQERRWERGYEREDKGIYTLPGKFDVEKGLQQCNILLINCKWSKEILYPASNFRALSGGFEGSQKHRAFWPPYTERKREQESVITATNITGRGVDEHTPFNKTRKKKVCRNARSYWFLEDGQRDTTASPLESRLSLDPSSKSNTILHFRNHIRETQDRWDSNTNNVVNIKEEQ